MSDLISCQDYELRSEPLIDIRTPSEYQAGHIAGAINIPLFTDDERAEVGLLYKQVSQQAAIDKGLELVGPKMAAVVQQVRNLGSDAVVIYCWRGGMRSKSMCWLLNMSGIKCKRLTDGYKAYRRYIRTRLANADNLVILGGYTGSGKTDVLLALPQFGVQILDLEGLANHKGSAFGHINEDRQPTTEQFENNLYAAFCRLDLHKLIMVENESRAIGRVNIPDPFFLKMRQAPVLVIKVPRNNRIKRLVALYTDTDKQVIIAAVAAIMRKLGGAKYQQVVQYINDDNFAAACDILLDYYDKFYQYGMDKRVPETIYHAKITGENLQQDAATIYAKINDIKK
jgi:tRNA 2-selenouridine synthase